MQKARSYKEKSYIKNSFYSFSIVNSCNRKYKN